MDSFSKAPTVSSEGQTEACIPTQPSELLQRLSGLLPQSGLALDLACGRGRNALFLAGRGLDVIGVDRSWDALAAGREAAVQFGLKVAYAQADLSTFALPCNSFFVVICFKYRNRDLYPTIRAALRPGGLFICESYTHEHSQYGRKPHDPDHLLERNELLRAFSDWEILFYREVWIDRGLASLVARKPFLAARC